MILGSLGVAAAVLGALLLVAGAGAVAVWVAGLLVATALVFATLTVAVDDRDLRFWFGPGLIRKRIPLADVRSWRLVENSWLLGWGIRIYGRGVLYNVSGLHAVELSLRDGRQLRLGTDEPAAVAEALRERLGDPPPLTAEELRAASARGRRWAAVVFVVALLVAGGAGGVVYGESRAPTASVDGAGLHVASFVYSAHLRPEEITSVELVDALPRVELRTNGTALGASLRGNFRLQGWGEGKLFLEADHPPFLVVKTRDTFVAVGWAEPERTRQLQAELRARLPR